MKITKEVKEEMKAMREEGAIFLEIAAKFGVSDSTVRYHLNKKYREVRLKRFKEDWKNLSEAKKKKIYKGRAKYLKEYYKKRYWSDEEYRKRRIQYSRDYYKKAKEKWKKN